jgi:hypothetical protein
VKSKCQLDMALLENNTNGQHYLIIQGVFTALAAIAVVLRLVARRTTATPLGFSDYSIIVALALVIGYCAAAGVAITPGGAGLHIGDLEPEELQIFGQAVLAEEFLWLSANTCIKLSILHFLLTIFCYKRSFPYFAYALMTLVTLSFITFFIIGFLACEPLVKSWNPETPGICALRTPAWLASSVLSVIFDICIFTLPIPVVCALQMRQARKLAIMAVFGLGVAIIVVAGLRINSILYISIPDHTFISLNVSQWSILDCTLGIINACMPLIPPVLTYVARHNVFTGAHRPTNTSFTSGASSGRCGERPGPRRGDAGSGKVVSVNRPCASNLGLDSSRHPHTSDDSKTGGDHRRLLPANLSFDPLIFYPQEIRAIENRREVTGVSSERQMSGISAAEPSKTPLRNGVERSHNATGRRAKRTCEGCSWGRTGLANLLVSRGGGGGSGGGNDNYDGDAGAVRLVGSSGNCPTNCNSNRLARPVDEESGLGELPDNPGGVMRDDSDNCDASDAGKGIKVTRTWDIDVKSIDGDDNNHVMTQPHARGRTNSA